MKNTHRNMRQKFESLSYPLMDKLYLTALRLTNHSLTAEDLVQEAYLRAWRFFDSFQPDTNFHAWIVRILTNIFINEYNKKKTQPLKVDFEYTLATFRDDNTADSASADASKVKVGWVRLFEPNNF